jgi:DNA-binding NarL/FixJ family response regulator
VLSRGLTNQQIADELFISVRTAETHVKRILSKLGLRSRTQVARWVLDRPPTDD